MISIVTFKWSKPGYRSTFTSTHVNVARAMVARHYPLPHRFLCVTDDPVGLDADIEVVPLWNDHASIPNPSWPTGPSCYRRLKVFSDWFGNIAGDRFVCMDLDVVITGDLRPLWDRTEPFLIWQTGNAAIPFCASMFMMTAGVHKNVWDDFNPATSPQQSLTSGMKGSDQAWIAYCLGKKIPGWGMKEGVYSYRDHCVAKYGCKLPKGARMVMFHGKPDPWQYTALQASPWIHEHYCE
jgi:hypothetical protein